MAKQKNDGYKRYYAKMAKYAFFVDVKDAEGKRVPVLDNRGAPVYVLGRPVYRQRAAVFNETLSTNVKIGCCVCHKTNDPDEIALLEEMAADSGTSVMTETAFKRSQNEAAFVAEQKMEAMQDQYDSVSEENKELKAKLEALEKAQAAQKAAPAPFIRPAQFAPVDKK